VNQIFHPMKKEKKNKRIWPIMVYCLLLAAAWNHVQAQKFEAEGPVFPVKQKPQEVGAVKVSFDLLPTTMSFDLPWRYCMVTENNIKVANFAAETYDPRDFDGTGGAASFEPGMDKEGRYVRVWIEHQSDARIVVRVRYALANNLYDIAHPDIPSGSPYGKGDWADEWHYIYPDGTSIRHMRIYTGLAPVSKPFAFDRVPPRTVHEFMEAIVSGPLGHIPTDDIEINALTLYRMFGGHAGSFIEEGIRTSIPFNPYPEDFGDFRDANIMLINLKSEYKPFIIGMPYGVSIQPYAPEGPLPFVFQTWGKPPEKLYTTALCHMLNYWHYRRTDNTLEQIYLHGMTNAADPQKELIALGWSWISEPELKMNGVEPDYTFYTYDPAQKAYILPRKGRGPIELEFSLEKRRLGPMSIVNPTFIVKDWDTTGVELKVDGERIEPGRDFRIGYEETATGTDLILWLKMTSSEPTKFKITPITK
jgi:hypothetical protein